MTLEQLNKRIQTTSDLRNIVSTMKMLSSVSVAQYTRAETGLKHYTDTLMEGFKALAVNGALPLQKNTSGQNSPANGKILLLLIGSDNGLVGSFNKGILLKADKFIKSNRLIRPETPCICLGRRLCGMAEYEKFNLIHKFPIAHNPDEIAGSASHLIALIQDEISQRGIERVEIFANKKIAETARVYQKTLIPFTLPALTNKQKIWDGPSFPMLSMPYEELLKALIHEYIMIVISKTIVSSLACEHYTRMIHMQQSEKNIDEKLEEMNLIYAQERQTNITNELIDIVSGANSVKKKKKSPISALTNIKKQDKNKGKQTNRKKKGVHYD